MGDIQRWKIQGSVSGVLPCFPSTPELGQVFFTYWLHSCANLQVQGAGIKYWSGLLSEPGFSTSGDIFMCLFHSSGDFFLKIHLHICTFSHKLVSLKTWFLGEESHECKS